MLFRTGDIGVTRGLYAAMQKDPRTEAAVIESVKNYTAGKWGELPAEDQAANDAALKSGSRLIGKYQTPAGPIYIITEADRRHTTVLFCDEY